MDEFEMLGRMVVARRIIEGCAEFSEIIPEVRSNIVYAREGALRKEDVLGIDGRITSVKGKPRSCGESIFGASSHMARFIIGIMGQYPEIRAGINFIYNPEMGRFLKEYCQERGWEIIGIDRSQEPAEAQAEEGESMSWKIDEVLKVEKTPKIIFESGAEGKEPVSALLGRDPVEVSREICHLAKAYSRRTHPRKIGKVDSKLLDSLLQDRLGVTNEKILIPPRSGVDAGAIVLDKERALAIAVDPIFSIPRLPLKFFGWAGVHIAASDIAVMGLRPRYMVYTLLLPPRASDEEIEEIMVSIHEAARDLGISIIGGHTGFVPGLESPMIGGATVLGIGRIEDVVSSMGARIGDLIVMTKGVAIEAVGALSVIREEELIERLGEDVVRKAQSLCWEMTVVKDARIAAAIGVSAMHDATEGGLIGALYELAEASDIGIEVEGSKIIIREEVKAVCDAIGIDPLRSISEGTLIITVDPAKAGGMVDSLEREGIRAGIIGRVTADRKRVIRWPEGEMEIEAPSTDPFWTAFFGE